MATRIEWHDEVRALFVYNNHSKGACDFKDTVMWIPIETVKPEVSGFPQRPRLLARGDLGSIVILFY